MSPAVAFFACLLFYVLWLLAGLHWPKLMFRPESAARIKIRLKLRVLFLVLIASVGFTFSLALSDADFGEKFMSFVAGVAIAWLMAFGTFLGIEYLLDINRQDT